MHCSVSSVSLKLRKLEPNVSLTQGFNLVKPKMLHKQMIHMRVQAGHVNTSTLYQLRPFTFLSCEGRPTSSSLQSKSQSRIKRPQHDHS